MTKQEAIRILEQSCPKRPQKLWSVKRTEAIHMAIEALQRGLENVNADSCSEKPNRSDLISRQDAMDALAKFVPYVIDDVSTESYTNGLTDAYNLICQLPSVQPEIIRCKDCKWHLTYHDEEYNVGYELCSNPMMMSGDSMIDMSNNDFCSKAERKDNG